MVGKIFKVLRFLPFLCAFSFFYYMFKSLFYPGKIKRMLLAYLSTMGTFLLFSFIFNALPAHALRTIFGLFGFVAVFFAGTECFRKGIPE